ncbi:unknown [Succinatimonas sp. CAG:777]|jgi:DNA-binding transcriptional regulator GbsR (MarR family)|nr:unknown [Succinatimonas sp. CAG:777]
MNDEVYPVFIPTAHLKPEYRKMKLTSKYILSRIIGLSKRCENKQVRISNSLLKYEVGFSKPQIIRAFKELEDLNLIKVDLKKGARRVINILFTIDELKASSELNTENSDNSNCVSNCERNVTRSGNETCTEYERNITRSGNETCIHKYEYKKEEIDIYRESIYKKILNDLSEGSISKIFMHDPATGNQLDSYIPFNYDPKEAVDSEGNCLFTQEPLDPEGYNLAQWMATNITYLGELCLMGKYGDECFPIYAESLLKRWNPKKAPLGKFLNIAVPNDFKGFKPRVIDYVEQYLGENVVFPAIKKIIKQRTSPSKVLEVLFNDYPQYFSAVKHDMNFGRYIYRLMYEVIKGDCEDVYTPYDSNRDFPTDEERAFDWGQQWFDAWSTDPQCLNKEAQEIALGIKPLHKELYGKEVMFDAFFD